jgi:Fic family protein
MRSGRFVKQPQNFRAFIPAPLPPEPPIDMDQELIRLLSSADRALGRLDGVSTILPNPDLFVAMYVRHEAVLSSQIEGTQSTLEDVLEYEIDAHGRDVPRDVEEVVNYVNALNYGLRRLRELPLSLRLIREIHAQLLRGVRGAERTPGEFRQSQNWIGPTGCTVATATFVPPPVHEMQTALGDFERFLHDTHYPALIQCGLAHAQFETIHPFLDGNGRVGRLLITFLLCQREILQLPLLYLSLYLKSHRAEYYDRLTAVRTDGNWEGWLKFFLKGIFEVSQSATETARAVLELRENHRQMITGALGGRAALGVRLLDVLFEQPIVSVSFAEQRLECTYVTANKMINQFMKLNLLHEITGGQRNRRFRYQPYLALFDALALDGRSPDEDQSKIETTESEPSSLSDDSNRQR